MVDHDGLGAAYFAAHCQHGARFSRFATLAVELHSIVGMGGNNAVKAGQEIRVPHGAAKLAVGHRLKANTFLQLNHIANAAIFNRAQLVAGDFTARGLGACVFQFLRAQQAANVIGAERSLTHCFLLRSAEPSDRATPRSGLLVVRPARNGRCLQ